MTYDKNKAKQIAISDADRIGKKHNKVIEVYFSKRFEHHFLLWRDIYTKINKELIIFNNAELIYTSKL